MSSYSLREERARGRGSRFLSALGMTDREQGQKQVQKQIPGGNDRKKGNGKTKGRGNGRGNGKSNGRGKGKSNDKGPSAGSGLWWV